MARLVPVLEVEAIAMVRVLHGEMKQYLVPVATSVL